MQKRFVLNNSNVEGCVDPSLVERDLADILVVEYES